MSGYLYRGVRAEMHRATNGVIKPRAWSFSRVPRADEDYVRADSGVVAGESSTNAVIAHQHDSSKFPSSGISTTLHFERAAFYATNGYDPSVAGCVYKIERRELRANGVRECLVADYATWPKVPQDDEVILVVSGNRALPRSAITEVVDVIRNRSTQNSSEQESAAHPLDAESRD
jgi:hypothetical protein